MIKTFRGLIANGAQDTINLHTNDGSTGYRIVKFQTIGKNLTGEANESVMQIWQSEPLAAVNKALVDFSSTILLAVAYWKSHGDTLFSQSVIFDSQIVNQDIYITQASPDTSEPCNYYLELEQVKLDLNENTVATLQSIRTQTSGSVLPP